MAIIRKLVQKTPTTEFIEEFIERVRHEWADGLWGEYHSGPESLMGLCFLGSGVSRSAFDLGDGRVLKVAQTDTIQMKWEIVAWQNMPVEHKQWVVPIIEHDKEYRWAIFKKVETNVNKAIEGKQRLLRELGTTVFTDMHPGNIGFDNGKPVMLDYAHYYKAREWAKNA